ncbi:MAG: N-acetylmuramoyl-L-alanine amidase [Bacteroidales bacterium]|nr:N-acetylmuramoyl-L-alanine amidase [Bacteroidales bacterium]
MERRTMTILGISLTALLGLGGLLYAKRNGLLYYSKVMLDKAKLALIGRKIDKIIIHCSATKPNQACTVELIDQWHKARGFNSIGYHYVIYQDGTVHEGRPVSQVGAHCVGQNANSIGICYVGGLDNYGNAKDTRTDAQKKTLKQVIKQLKQTFPNATVHGHNEFANKACPCFNVKNEF